MRLSPIRFNIDITLLFFFFKIIVPGYLPTINVMYLRPVKMFYIMHVSNLLLPLKQNLNVKLLSGLNNEKHYSNMMTTSILYITVAISRICFKSAQG